MDKKSHNPQKANLLSAADKAIFNYKCDLTNGIKLQFHLSDRL